MTRKEAPRNVAASVRARLAARALEQGDPFDLVLTRYGVERLLHRLSRSRYRDEFTLKGAVLFRVWDEQPHRPTLDLDLLGRRPRSVDQVVEVFREICREAVEDDGVTFQAESIRGAPIRTERENGGVRVHLQATLDRALIRLQVDIGFGDTTTPGPMQIDFPTLLSNLPAPRKLHAYRRDTVVAEKLHAMVTHGIDNSRMKDFFDVCWLCRRYAFDGATLCAAIGSTFGSRGALLPDGPPVALTEEFAAHATKRTQWEAFLRKGRISGEPLDQIVPILRDFLMPPLNAVRDGSSFGASWPPGGPWTG